MVNKRENVWHAIRNFTIEHLSFQSSTRKLAIKNFEKGNSQILLIERFFSFRFCLFFFVCCYIQGYSYWLFAGNEGVYYNPFVNCLVTEKGKRERPEYPAENLSEQGGEPTTNSNTYGRRRDSNRARKLVGGECSHHSAILVPYNNTIIDTIIWFILIHVLKNVMCHTIYLNT